MIEEMMTDQEEGGWRMINTQMAADVHTALRILAKRYKAKNKIKGKVPLSDALRFFLQENDPALAAMAERQATEQDAIADSE